jgi:hypothetical protein
VIYVRPFRPDAELPDGTRVEVVGTPWRTGFTLFQTVRTLRGTLRAEPAENVHAKTHEFEVPHA